MLIWIGNVCKKIFSYSFKMYDNGIISYDKVKVFCSENFIRNLLLYS